MVYCFLVLGGAVHADGTTAKRTTKQSVKTATPPNDTKSTARGTQPSTLRWIAPAIDLQQWKLQSPIVNSHYRLRLATITTGIHYRASQRWHGSVRGGVADGEASANHNDVRMRLKRGGYVSGEFSYANSLWGLPWSLGAELHHGLFHSDNLVFQNATFGLNSVYRLAWTSWRVPLRVHCPKPIYRDLRPFVGLAYADGRLRMDRGWFHNNDDRLYAEGRFGAELGFRTQAAVDEFSLSLGQGGALRLSLAWDF